MQKIEGDTIVNIKNRVKNKLPVKLVAKLKSVYLNKKGIVKATTEPQLLNANGEKIRTFYLCDVNTGHDLSLTDGRKSKYVNWDRTRYTLPIHFYTDDMIWIKRGNPKKKFAILLEPQTLQPAKYKRILSHPEEVSDYEAIFTYSEEILENVPNARLFITGGVYVGTEFGGGEICEEQYKKKTKNISMVSSDKRTCELHEIRYKLAQRLDAGEDVDCYGTFNGTFIKIGDSLGAYRYSIVIENDIGNYWITERICNCFASMTVPIYIGSPKIGEFFNLDGIIQISKDDVNNIDNIIKQCNQEDYERRVDAIKDNFERVKKFYCVEDWLFNEYGELFL